MHAASIALPFSRPFPVRGACPPWRGIAAGLAVAAIWGGTLAMTRLGVAGAGALGPHDIAMLRFLGPALVLGPVLLRALPALRRAGLANLLAMLIGGGVPYVLVAGTGLRFAGAAEAGALLPGTAPLCVAAGSVLLLGERFRRLNLLGLGLILLAVLLVAGPAVAAGSPAAWHGHALLLAAAALAAAYVIGLRRAGLGAWEAAAAVAVGSVLGFAPVYLFVLEPRLLVAPWQEVGLQAVCQGFVSGLLAPVTFAVAVRHLGAARATAFGGLSPAAAALLGMMLLGELPDRATMLALVAGGIGVVLVSRRT